ncbi:MAG: hypothetical protein LBK60_07645 [Verrucomicrobiales bacterium]|nr:hypothetical protein [Verrucomicrobiales bacterium]
MKTLPVYLVTGFLGSGKSTLLARLIGSGPFPRETSALIINSAGPLPLTPAALQGAAGRVAALAGGCACCASPWALISQLRQYAADPGLARVWIEASGAANPGELRALLRLQNWLALRRVTYVLDATRPAHGWEHQARHAEVLFINRAAQIPPAALAGLRQGWRADGDVCLDCAAVAAALAR